MSLNSAVKLTAVALAVMAAACGSSSEPRLLGIGIAGCAALPADGGSGDADGHGQPERSDGEVEVTPEGQGFRAAQVITLSNDFGGASRAEIEFTTVNGAILNCAGGQGGYGIEVRLEARGPTEQTARDALASMQVRHADSLSGGQISLDTAVQFGDFPDAAAERSAAILAAMPGAASYVLRHGTLNGSVEASGLVGTSAILRSSNGSLTLDGAWDRASLETDNGSVNAAGDFAALSGASNNGSVSAELATRRNVSAALRSDNGSVEAALVVTGTPGFDLTAQTGNGRATIAVADAEPVGPQEENSARHMTPDYAARPVKVQIQADSGNGSVSIHD